MQALEGIIDCAWNDCTRKFLKEVNAGILLEGQEVYIWDFCDASLQIASHLAYTCV